MSHTERVTPEPPSDVPHNFRNRKRCCLVILAVVAAVLGGISPGVPEGASVGTALTGVGALLLLSCGFTWLYLDSIERHFRIGVLLGVSIILVSGVGVPIYFFRTRGLRGFASLVLLFLFGCLLVAIYSGFYYAVWYVVWFVCRRGG